MCDFCDNIPTETERILLSHSFEPEGGIEFEYGVQLFRQDGAVYLSLYDAYNGETAYKAIRHCPECGRKLTETDK